MGDEISLDDLRNPDYRPTEIQTMDDVMILFKESLVSLLGEGTLLDDVCENAKAFLRDLALGSQWGAAYEIADVFGAKASILEQVTAMEEKASAIAMAHMWREAERIARTFLDNPEAEIV